MVQTTNQLNKNTINYEPAMHQTEDLYDSLPLQRKCEGYK